MSLLFCFANYHYSMTTQGTVGNLKMKVIPANVHKGTADHKKHTEASAKKAFTPVWLINGFTVD